MQQKIWDSCSDIKGNISVTTVDQSQPELLAFINVDIHEQTTDMLVWGTQTGQQVDVYVQDVDQAQGNKYQFCLAASVLNPLTTKRTPNFTSNRQFQLNRLCWLNKSQLVSQQYLFNSKDESRTGRHVKSELC